MTTTETTETAPADDRVAQIHQALAGVIDPEIHRPITELGMVDEVSVDEEGIARVRVLLTIEGCPCGTASSRTPPRPPPPCRA